MGRVRRPISIVVLGLAAGAGAVLAGRLAARRPSIPDPPAVALQVREVARLETLDLSLYKKVDFAPGPLPAGSFWGDVLAWARYTLRPPRGRAIVFADAHVGLDLDRLGPGNLRVVGREAWIVLPPLRVGVELKPGETEVIGSNLDTAETARLFELAKVAFEQEVAGDARLRERARGSAERAIRGLLLGLGFTGVHFVDALPGPGAG
jgi:hypothetical protein